LSLPNGVKSFFFSVFSSSYFVKSYQLLAYSEEDKTVKGETTWWNVWTSWKRRAL